MRRIDEESSFRMGLIGCAIVFALVSSIVMAEQIKHRKGTNCAGVQVASATSTA
jgi:hypothetical protein